MPRITPLFNALPGTQTRGSRPRLPRRSAPITAGNAAYLLPPIDFDSPRLNSVQDTSLHYSPSPLAYDCPAELPQPDTPKHLITKGRNLGVVLIACAIVMFVWEMYKLYKLYNRFGRRVSERTALLKEKKGSSWDQDLERAAVDGPLTIPAPTSVPGSGPLTVLPPIPFADSAPAPAPTPAPTPSQLPEPAPKRHFYTSTWARVLAGPDIHTNTRAYTTNKTTTSKWTLADSMDCVCPGCMVEDFESCDLKLDDDF